MGDSLKKVRAGGKLRIPAAAYNAFVDAAQDLENRRHRQQRFPAAGQRSSGGTGLVLVKNSSGTAQERFAVLGVLDPIFTPADNADAFKNTVAFRGVTPSDSEHCGRYVILLEPLDVDAIGTACASGVCPVKLSVPDDDPADLYTTRHAEIDDGSSDHLLAGRSGSAQILWKEEGTGIVWGLVRVGNAPAVPPGVLFAVMLQQTGGSAGDDDTRCSFTYGVSDLLGHGLAQDAAPVCKRPYGMMEAAWHGSGYYDPDDQFVLYQVDETPVTWTCQSD